jgi:hypothetical protein
MRISAGWAGEYARKKFGIELDDQTDLPLFLVEAGLDPDEVMPQLQLFAKYQILKTEAERLALQAAVEAGIAEGNPAEQQRMSAQLQGFGSKRAGYIEYLREKYGTAEQKAGWAQAAAQAAAQLQHQPA